MRVFFIYFFIFLSAINTSAQELNFGIHANPAFTTPVFDGQTKYDRAIRVSRARFDFNLGANINYKTGNLAIETGVNIINKDIIFKIGSAKDVGFANGTFADAASKSTSIEIPLLLSYCIHHHDKKLVYNTYLVAGGSYERYSFDGSNMGEGYQSSIANGAGTNTVVIKNFDATFAEGDNQWFNIVAGFKINTVVRVLGLIDYGVTFHMPLKANGPYTISADVTEFSTGTPITNTYTGNFNPYLGYLDIKLCYYFLNLDNQLKRMRHRMPG